MRGIAVSILFVVVAHAHILSVASHPVDDLTNRLRNRTLKASSLDHVDVDHGLDDTTLKKPGHLAISQRAPAISPPSSLLASQSASGISRIMHVAHAEPTIAPVEKNIFGVRKFKPNVGKAEDLAKQGKASDNIGFRWDPAMNRWVRDDNAGDKVGNWADKGGAISKPMTGAEFTIWPAVYLGLMDRGLKSISGEEALKMVQNKGAILVDVDLADKFERETMEGAVSAPLYTEVKGRDAMSNLKIVVNALLAMQATERDPEYRKNSLAKLPKGRPLIVACSRGGSTVTSVKKIRLRGDGTQKLIDYQDPEKAFGIESRSLKACYELLEAGFNEVYHLQGGINQYRSDGLPMAPGDLEWTGGEAKSAGLGSLFR